MNPLPPQAYTKDTLLKAYHWLQAQTPSIREMALTPDILVSLYLKSTRDGDHALERPSVQNFKNELKNLAGMMGELDQTGPLSPSPATILPSAAPVSTPAPQYAAAPQNSFAGGVLLDSQSQKMIQDIKELLNLGSDHEALRAAIKMGHTKAISSLK